MPHARRLVVDHQNCGLRLRGLSARHWLRLITTCNLTGKSVETDANGNEKIGHCVRREHARMEWVEFSYAIGWTRVWITHRRNHRRRRFWRVQSKRLARVRRMGRRYQRVFVRVRERKEEESDKMRKNWRKWDGNNRRGR